MITMTDQQLQKLVEETSENLFGKSFQHEAKMNSRLRTTGGRYLLQSHAIEINPRVLELHGMEELIGVIKHELCHYHLHLEGRGYRHRDADFRSLMKETNSPRFCKSLVTPKEIEKKFRIYECVSCKIQYKRKKRMSIERYRCGQCYSEIIEIGI